MHREPQHLQTIELLADQVKRLQQVLRICLDKFEAGEHMSDEMIVEYRRQMATVDEQRERLAQLLITLRQGTTTDRIQ